MTDLETMRAMLVKAKIEFKEEMFGEYAEIPTSPGSPRRYSGGVPTIIVEDGYPCFYTRMTFDAAGALVSIEAYE